MLAWGRIRAQIVSMPELNAPTLRTPRLRLETIAPRRAAALADFHFRNGERLRRWSPPAPPAPTGPTDAGYWLAKAAEHEAERRAGRALRWLLFRHEASDVLVGTASLTGIERGPFQSGRLGYQIDGACEGRGLMQEALQAVIAHAFDELRLHRLEANHLPENERSARLLARLGFERIGVAPSYLFIDGAWRDHVLNQLLSSRADPVEFGRTLVA